MKNKSQMTITVGIDNLELAADVAAWMKGN
jgi:hypothetical protein